jgi:hypothetical protein
MRDSFEPKPILDRDPAADLWRKVGIPRSRDIRHLLPPSMPRSQRFETPSDAKVRKKKLVLILEGLEPAIADGYDNCSPDAPCSIPGCPSCSRWHRGYLYSETARINELPLAGPREFVTVYLATIPFGELSRVRIKDEHKRFQKRLERYSFRGSLMIGGTEVAWDAAKRVWILHLHIFSIGVDPAAWERLRTSLRGAGGAIPLKREALKDAARPLSYKQKWFTYFRPHRRLGKRLSDPVPLKPPQVAELCRWWACHRFEDFTFLFGARRRGGRIEPEPRDQPVGLVGIPRVIFSRTLSVESIVHGMTVRVSWRDEISFQG